MKQNSCTKVKSTIRGWDHPDFYQDTKNKLTIDSRFTHELTKNSHYLFKIVLI